MASFREEAKGLKMLMMMLFTTMLIMVKAIDTNPVYDPCSDATVQKSDGFTFGLAFSSKESFFAPDQVQLSPCDSRLQLAVFRPTVDEISLLTINSTFNPVTLGGYMVAFSGRKYAARSDPVLIADNANTIISFNLVLEFQKGILQNLYWKKFGCESCKNDTQVCVNGQDCGVPTTKCSFGGGSTDCTIRIQLTFSGTDKNSDVLNSWYEVKNMRRFSLYGLFSDLKDSITNGLF